MHGNTITVCFEDVSWFELIGGGQKCGGKKKRKTKK